MEKVINQHIDTYFSKFKNDIQLKSINLDFSEKDKINELLEYIFEYEKQNLPKEIFMKKTKVTSSQQQSSQYSLTPTVQEEERCVAMRKQGDRCNRKRTKGNMYCGTHCIKHIQQGCGLGQEISISNEGNINQYIISNSDNIHLEVIAQEIQGIIYYMDKELNVYNTEDIFKNLNNPKIIAKAVQLGNNVYSIPSLGL